MSIEDFIKVLNSHLNDVGISKEQKKLLEKQIEEMTILIRKFHGMKKYNKIKSKNQLNLQIILLMKMISIMTRLLK